MDRLSLLEPVRRDFDLAVLRLPGEGELRREADRRPALRELVALWSDPRRAPCEALRPLAGGVGPVDAFCPALARLAELLRHTLRLSQKVEILLADSTLWLCEAFSEPNDQRITVRLAGGILEKLGVCGALFFIGRRLARPLFDQFPIPVDPTASADPIPHNQLLLRGLWRFQELTADRLGLVCCQDFDLAARTILKSQTGLYDALLHPDWDALLSERVSEEQALAGASSHDFCLLRLAALRSFAGSEKYRQIFAAGASTAVAVPAEASPPTPVSKAVEPEWIEPMLAYDRRDPAFSRYPFQVDQPVEVLLDGIWVVGRVREVDSTGDLRVYFADQDEVLRLNPTADLIRPATHRAAG